MLSKIKEGLAIPIRLCIVLMGSAYFLFPPNSDRTTILIVLLASFRVVSCLSIGIFWGLVGIILGLFWEKLKPHETSKIARRQK